MKLDLILCSNTLYYKTIPIIFTFIFQVIINNSSYLKDPAYSMKVEEFFVSNFNKIVIFLRD